MNTSFPSSFCIFKVRFNTFFWINDITDKIVILTIKSQEWRPSLNTSQSTLLISEVISSSSCMWGERGRKKQKLEMRSVCFISALTEMMSSEASENWYKYSTKIFLATILAYTCKCVASCSKLLFISSQAILSAQGSLILTTFEGTLDKMPQAFATQTDHLLKRLLHPLFSQNV